MSGQTVFSIRNLTEHEIVEILPWEWDGHPGYKKHPKRRWNDEGVEHCHFSLVQGKSKFSRVTSENEASVVYGLVADYDHPLTDEHIEAAGSLIIEEYAPNLFSRTQSGGGRVVWFFKEGVVIQGNAHYSRFLKAMQRVVGADRILPCLDVGAWKDPVKYYEAGIEWVELSKKRIPTETVIFHAAKTARVSDLEGESVSIRFERIEEEARKRGWDKRWGKPFSDGQRGCRFWDDNYESGQLGSVVMNARGCFNHSTTYGKPGQNTWEDIFGKRFVDEIEASTFGKALEDFFYLNGKYYRHVGDFDWINLPLASARRHLVGDYGLDNKIQKGQTLSQVDELLNLVEKENQVEGIGPFLYAPNKIQYVGGVRFLNDSKVLPIQPAPDTGVEVSKFPMLYDLIGTMFGDPYEFYIAWCHRTYSGAHNGQMMSGQNLILAGDPGCGKTFMAKAVLGMLMGGTADAHSFLLNDTKYNGNLARYSIWVVDDEVGRDNYKDKVTFSANMKKVAACGEIEYNEKYKPAFNLPWVGRVILNCNKDAESIQIVPDLSMSMVDKFMVFDVKQGFKFKSNEENYKCLQQEMPYFARYLLEYKIPDALADSPRFGVKSYICEDIASTARENAPEMHFADMLDAWAKIAKKNKDTSQFFMTPSDMMQELNTIVSSDLTKNPTGVGRNLNKLIQQNEKAERVGRDLPYPYLSKGSRGCKGSRYFFNLEKYEERKDPVSE